MRNLNIALSILLNAIAMGVFVALINYFNVVHSHIDGTNELIDQYVFNTRFDTSILTLFAPMYLFMLSIIGSYSDFVGRSKVSIVIQIFIILAFILALFSFEAETNLLFYLASSFSSFIMCNFVVHFAMLCDLNRRRILALSFILISLLYLVFQATAYIANFMLLVWHIEVQKVLLIAIFIASLSLWIIVLNYLKFSDNQVINRMKSKNFLLDLSAEVIRFSRVKSNWMMLLIVVFFVAVWGLADRYGVFQSDSMQWLDNNVLDFSKVHLTNILISAVLVMVIYPLVVWVNRPKWLLCIFSVLMVVGSALIASGYYLINFRSSFLIVLLCKNVVFALLFYLYIRNVSAKQYGLAIGSFLMLEQLIWCLTQGSNLYA